MNLPQLSGARLGMALMVGATFVFGTQDALSRYLAENYSVLGVLLIRYWFFAAFVLVRAVRAPGGLRTVIHSKKPLLQSVRGVMLVVQVWMMVNAFSWLGLVETHALFASYPLMIAALAGPVLGERVTTRQWAAISAGTVGVLLILRPGAGLFSPISLFVLLAALNFAAYGLLTRIVGLHDRPETASSTRGSPAPLRSPCSRRGSGFPSSRRTGAGWRCSASPAPLATTC